MNVKLLRQVKRHILEEPKRLQMGIWSASAKRQVRQGYMEKDEAPACGTTGCIAGWAVILHKAGSRTDFLKVLRSIRGHDYRHVMQPKAIALLELTEAQADSLFFVGDWPGSFEGDYMNCKTPKQRARVTAKRIEHFIRTKGEE